MRRRQLQWSRALVTGASSGVGAAFARQLARQGCQVTLVARRRGHLEGLAAELASSGPRGLVLPADLSTDEGLASVVRAIEASPPELLVNAAGFGTRRFVAELAPEKLEAMVRLQTLAPVRLTRAALPTMIADGRGAIVNVSSLAAFFTTSRYTTYSATKAFLNTFSKGLAIELAGKGVHVQALCPGLTRTEFFQAPDQEGFDYPGVPRWVWQEPEEVVSISLAALGGGTVVVIPGRLNRLVYETMRSRLVSALIERTSQDLVNAEERPW